MVLSSNASLSRRTQVILSGSASGSMRRVVRMVALKSLTNLSPSLKVVHTVRTEGSISNGIPVRIMNTFTNNIGLFAGQNIADFCFMVEFLECHASEAHFIYSTTEHPSVETELKATLSTSSSSPDKSLLLGALMRFTDVFQPDLDETNETTHKINNRTSPPVRQYPCHLPYV